MQKTLPCLWFTDQAAEAAKFYTSVFKNSKVAETSYYGDAGPMPKGTVMTVRFMIAGNEYMALNGGARFPFTQAVSLVVNCDSQKEIDTYWSKLTADGGAEVECGWLKDKYGLMWQIVPTVLPKLMRDKDPKRRDRVMRALLKMKKLDIAALKAAADATSAPRPKVAKTAPPARGKAAARAADSDGDSRGEKESLAPAKFGGLRDRKSVARAGMNAQAKPIDTRAIIRATEGKRWTARQQGRG